MTVATVSTERRSPPRERGEVTTVWLWPRLLPWGLLLVGALATPPATVPPALLLVLLLYTLVGQVLIWLRPGWTPLLLSLDVLPSSPLLLVTALTPLAAHLVGLQVVLAGLHGGLKRGLLAAGLCTALLLALVWLGHGAWLVQSPLVAVLFGLGLWGTGLIAGLWAAATQAQIRAARAETARALARLSHDLRTPLGLIRGYADLLRRLEPALTSEQRQRYLSEISANVERIVSLLPERPPTA